ncbi:hypothetical protein ACQ4M3_40545 [Leptolyngbya sp. AN03gr2]|uniref:hypothetical protein n=1 Tax=unclassified Leptolyngbya TaxID=2650499 RepID=UPI003D315590
MSGLSQPLKLGRRQFNQLIALTTANLFVSETCFPKSAHAEELISDREQYHIFIPNKIAERGGKQVITLKSGIVKTLKIPKRSEEGTKIKLNNAARDQGEAIVILHTLYDPSLDIDGMIEQVLVSIPLLKATRDRCRDVYQQLKSGTSVHDLTALDLLDIMVSGSSRLKKADSGEQIKTRFRLASENAKLVELQTYLETTIDQTELPSEQKRQLKGIYQYVRSGEALPDLNSFETLSAIDAMVQGSDLPILIRQRYEIASAQTRAFTADESIQATIRQRHQADKVKQYLQIYHQVRIGEEIVDEDMLATLDSLIDSSQLPREVKAIYRLARDRFYLQNNQQTVEQDLQTYLQAGRDTAKIASGIVPAMTQIFAAGGVTAGTGTAIGTLIRCSSHKCDVSRLGRWFSCNWRTRNARWISGRDRGRSFSWSCCTRFSHRCCWDEFRRTTETWDRCDYWNTYKCSNHGHILGSGQYLCDCW